MACERQNPPHIAPMLFPIVNSAPDEATSELIQFGVVFATNLEQGTAIVQIGEVQTPFIPWLERAGWLKTFVAPKIGEQVLVLVPNGDMMGAVIIGGLFSNDNPAPSQNQVFSIKSEDGLNFQYDPATGIISLNCPGTIEIVANAVEITGDLNVTGAIASSGDVTAAGKSFLAHKHIGVQSGASITGLIQ